MRLLRIFPFLIFVLLLQFKTYATHIRAGDLYAKINPNNSSDPRAYRTVQFTLNIYADKSSVDGNDDDGCNGLGNCAELNFGDSYTSGKVPYASRTPVGNNTYLIVYYFTHTYGKEGYIDVSYFDENRNNGIQNLSSPSNTLPFFIEMKIFIDRGVGKNQTPQLTIPPVDLAEQNRIFIHNPGAYDVDGDSISYKPLQPQIGDGIFDPNYIDPNLKFGGTTQNESGPATYSVNAANGDVIWNAPKNPGLYNIAFMIEEWRVIGNRRARISYSVRDMQINVKEGLNHPPVIKVRSDSCISPNVYFQSIVEVNDPDLNRITLTTYGELFDQKKAEINPEGQNVPSPFNTTFTWTPKCSDVRGRPYQAFFKAIDQNQAPGFNSLSDIKSFYLTVVGPSPTNFKVTPDSLKPRIYLNWDPYFCISAARKMEIYRRVGCDSIKSRNCVLGKPNDNYVLIATVDIGTTSFIDSTAKRGNIYSYAISAQFVDNFQKTANSYPSKNFCVELPLIAPLITKVSFESSLKNQILIKWIKPVKIDTAKFKPPFQYRLFKKIIGASSYALLKEFNPTNQLYDSSYLDKDIEPGKNYLYYIQLSYMQKGLVYVLKDSSEVSTNVELKTVPISRGIRLEWSANTPWQNSLEGYKHRIWRKSKGDLDFKLIDSVDFVQNVTQYSYNDLSLIKNDFKALCDTQFYYVTTSGSYKNPQIAPDAIVNNSFIAKGTILNDVPPSAPELDEYTYDCNSFSQLHPFKNNISWGKISSSIPCFEVAGYNIYYSSLVSDEEMTFLAKVDTSASPSFSHGNLASVAGCYSVTAFDNVGNESLKSNKLCLQNCYLYELPNVFTPNNSGVNDLFRPIPPSPRFVESVEFAVFNRWGGKVFESNDDILINWDGSGLPDGVYFYTAKVKFISGDQNTAGKDLKGWIQIIR